MTWYHIQAQQTQKSPFSLLKQSSEFRHLLFRFRRHLVIYIILQKNHISRWPTFWREKYILRVGTADKWLCGERWRMTDVSLPCIYTLITLLNMVIMIRHSDPSQGKAYLSKLQNLSVQFEQYICIYLRLRMADVSLPCIYTLITLLSRVFMIRHPDHSLGKAKCICKNWMIYLRWERWWVTDRP